MASAAGLGEIAEPPSLVADAIVEALEKEEFHALPDTMAKQVGEAYESFARTRPISSNQAHSGTDERKPPPASHRPRQTRIAWSFPIGHRQPP